VCPLESQDGNVVGLVSQSRVLEFLHKNIDKFPDADITVDSFWKPGHQPLVSVPIQEDAIMAFKQMFDFVRTHLNVALRHDATLMWSCVAITH
jgi:hypothetical protein